MNRLNAFFALVRAGLWSDCPAAGQLDASPFEGATEADWQVLYRLALSQALVAVCFDGLRQLPPACRPPRSLYLQWAARMAQVEQANRLLNETLEQVVALCREQGVHPVLLKGQGMAACYVEPLHRQCGDIDLFVGRDDAPATVQLLEAHGARRTGEESYKHTCLTWKGVHLEIHRLVGRLNNPLSNRQMQRWVGEWYPQAIAYRKGLPVPHPPFDAFFIFQHAFGHFLNSGIGLRQLCDWARLLYTLRGSLDAGALQERLRRMGLLRAARVFGTLLLHQLGLPSDCLPVAPSDRPDLQELLLEEILATGNFGQWDDRIPPRPKGYWSGKWHTFTRALRRCRTLYRFAPSEAFWYPLVLIQGTLIIQYNRLIHSHRA